MVQDIALNIHVRPVTDLDDPPVAERRDERLLDCREGLAVGSLDLHGVFDPQHLLLDLRELVALRILKDQGLADAQGFTIDLIDALATVILDPIVIADRYELLAHLVVGGVPATPKRRALFLPLFSSVSHPCPPSSC